MIDKRTLLPRLAVLGGLAFSLPVYAQFSSPTRDVDNGARQPANFNFTVQVNPGNSAGFNNIAVGVPAGKRLVIETISCFAGVFPGELGVLTVTVTAGAGTAAGATSAPHNIFLPKLYSTSGVDFIGVIGAFRMYADTGLVQVSYSRNTTTGGSTVNVVITGHYVNL
jgi:hypothetical protein